MATSTETLSTRGQTLSPASPQTTDLGTPHKETRDDSDAIRGTTATVSTPPPGAREPEEKNLLLPQEVTTQSLPEASVSTERGLVAIVPSVVNHPGSSRRRSLSSVRDDRPLDEDPKAPLARPPRQQRRMVPTKRGSRAKSAAGGGKVAASKHKRVGVISPAQELAWQQDFAKPTRARSAQVMKTPPPRHISEERWPASASDTMHKEKAACGGAGLGSDLGDSQARLGVEATPTGPTNVTKGEAVVTKVLHPNTNANPSPNWCCIRTRAAWHIHASPCSGATSLQPQEGTPMQDVIRAATHGDEVVIEEQDEELPAENPREILNRIKACTFPETHNSSSQRHAQAKSALQGANKQRRWRDGFEVPRLGVAETR